MFKQLFGPKQTTRLDVVVAISAAVIAAYKALETLNDYKEGTVK